MDLRGALGEADMVTLIANKFGAPKDIAYMYVLPGCLAKRRRLDPGLYWCSGALLLGGDWVGGEGRNQKRTI